MDRQLILTLYTPRWLARHLECHEVLSSTNDAAMALLAERGEAAHGAVVFADRQTAGRGRLGRTWHTPPGAALALSVALWPGEAEPGTLALLPLACALAVSGALERSAGLACRLKWPNDVLCGGRKISGTMAEARWQGSRPAGLVLGVGVNLNQPPGGWPPDIAATATSVLMETGRTVQPEAAAASLLESLQGTIEQALESPGRVVQLAGHLWDHEPGDELEVLDGPRAVRGRFLCVDDAGSLVLDTPEGRQAVRYGDARKLRRIP